MPIRISRFGFPLDSKLPIHLVLTANASVLRTPKNYGRVRELIKRFCIRHGVTIYEFANVGNHIHLLIKLRSIRDWASFIRQLTGQIAQRLGVKWKDRPFTRIVRGWKRAFKIAKEYIHLNVLEAEGFINRREIKTLKDYRQLIASFEFS